MKVKNGPQKIMFLNSLILNFRPIFYVEKLKRNVYSTCFNDRSMTILDIFGGFSL